MAAEMLKKFQPNISYSMHAHGLGAENTKASESAVNQLITNGAAAIAEKENDIKAFTAQTQLKSAGGFLNLPLCGLPVGVKDIVDTANMPTQHGSEIYKGHQPKADAAVVSLIRRAGGQVTQKTVTTEFAFLNPNVTRNPHNLNHTPGGSSSGSAASVAAGMLPFAIGTQTGGSIIRPASYCGVVGYKPTFGSIPTVGTKTFSWSLDTLGFFAPSIPDAHFLWSKLMQTQERSFVEKSAVTIGIAKTQLWDEASNDVKEAVDRASGLWSQKGAQVVELDWPALFTKAYEAHLTIQDYECCRALAWEMDTHSHLISPLLLETLQAGLLVSRDAYLEAQETAHKARSEFADMQTTVDVILTPSASSAAPATLKSTGTSIFNRFLTLMGVPCIHLPAFATEAGLPVGVQLVGRFGEDDALLSLADRLWNEL